jgi:hypothetical protein
MRDCWEESPALCGKEYIPKHGSLYETETTEIVKRFLLYRLEFPECINALDAALARFTTRMTNEQVGRFRIIVLAWSPTNPSVTRSAAPPSRYPFV